MRMRKREREKGGENNWFHWNIKDLMNWTNKKEYELLKKAWKS